mgnify:CR=1 FL=1
METGRILINEGWKFALTDDINAPESAFESVFLPHDWQIRNPQDMNMPDGTCQGFFPRNQVGVYRYYFTAHEEWNGNYDRVKETLRTQKVIQ